MTSIALPRKARFAAYAAAIGLMLGGFALPARAAADPDSDTWDIEQYDACMNKTIRDPGRCCYESGGVWDLLHQTCMAPVPATPARGPQPPRVDTSRIGPDTPAVTVAPTG